jgi:hypothetical protein
MAADFFRKLGATLDDSAVAHPDVAAIVLRVIVDHLRAASQHETDDLARIESLACAAIAQSRTGAVEAVAQIFARHPQTTSAILAALIAKGGAAALAALAFGQRVERALLMRAAAEGPADHAVAVARRPMLEDALVIGLVRRPEPEVLAALATNRSVRFDRPTLVWLVLRGRHDPALARALLSRAPLPCDVTPLFMAASREERAAMVLDAWRRDLARPPALAPVLTPADRASLEAAIEHDDAKAISECFASLLAMSRTEAATMAADAGGEPLALMCCATGISGALARNLALFLLAADAASPQAVAMQAILRTLSPASACRMLESILGRPLMRARRNQRAATGDHHDARAGAERRRAAAGSSPAAGRTGL